MAYALVLGLAVVGAFVLGWRHQTLAKTKAMAIDLEDRLKKLELRLMTVDNRTKTTSLVR